MQRHPSPILGRHGRRLLSGLLVVSAVLALWVGTPRFLAELMLVPGGPALRKITTGAELATKDLETLEQSRLSAIRFADLPQYHADLSSAYLARAQKADDPAERLKYAGMAIEESRTSLDKAPLNPFAWARISAAELMFGPTHYDRAREAWRTSIRLEVFEPQLILQRIHVGILLYTHLGKDDIEVLKKQIDMAFTWRRDITLNYIRKYNLTMWAVLVCGPDSPVTRSLQRP